MINPGFNFRHIKTGILVTLVVVSFGLSYLLWNGNWKNTTEAGFSTTNALPPAEFPRALEAAAPYQLVLTMTKPVKASVMMPGNPAYQQWITELGAIHLKDFHSVTVLPAHTYAKVEYDFSTVLSKVSMLKWLPNLSSTVLPAEARTISLYTLNQTGPVFVALQGDSAEYIGQTDMSGEDLVHSVSKEATSTPWIHWDGKNGDFIPSGKFTMDKLTFEISSTPVLPLVHSFFVNPQVLTRIQENQNTVLWTDGSRAVQWDKARQLLVFEDPNFNGQSLYTEANLDTASSFIRNHGGAPKNAIVFDPDSSSMLGGTSTYVFMPVLGGYPIYETQFAYEIEVYQGYVVRYERPLIELSRQSSAVHETVLGPKSISSIVKHAVLHQNSPSVDLKLGYYPVVKTQTVILLPSFYLYINGNLTETFDASTGEVLSKGGQS
jgi:regulatory protein YycH of two-component signal transduction system YycFG